MTSSMLSGDRRWASSSSRRGGMTVLGKVAVPKPINLPSQRLENHGLDPNVEIVPKGTLSWGSKSSSASNAWGSSLSPNTDGGSSSPSRLSARPSSGGSGTRPSTAGSDRALEPTANAWGSNSRPSSSSGSLTTNQASLTSLRPRSAETRPGSSQLSRFAEPLTENSAAWSAARTADKLGVSQAKNEEFSLSSGDFPTLGSEKDKSQNNSELQDHSSHGRPGSSSGLGTERAETTSVDDVSVDANVNGGTVISWGGDYLTPNDDGVKPGMEKWQGNPQPYPSGGIAPQHYDAWHVPPVNNPQGGVWFRGPPGGPPFGSPVAPGGFPMEAFSYYRPHIPPTGLVSQPPVPPPGAGPRGHHPKNGDVYRPHMPDSYICPGMPIRPGFYPGPMAYDGYYSPQMGYCNSNDRDVPFMGMSAGPAVYNRYPNQNPPEPGSLQGRSGGYVSSGKQSSKQGESSHPPDTGGPYRVLLKQHNEWDGKNEPSNWEDSETANPYADGRDQKRMPGWENEQKSDHRIKEEVNLRAGACVEEASFQTSENQRYSFSVKAEHFQSAGNIKTSNDISARKLEDTASGVEEVPVRPVAPKESSLIQKIEGLNAKVRDNSSAKSREEQRNKFHNAGAPVNHVENGVVPGDVLPENPPLREVNASGGEKNLESLSFSGTATSRRAVHGIQGIADHRNKGRFNSQDPDEWRNKSVDADSISSSSQLEASNVHIGDHCISIETYDKSGSYHQPRHDGESVQSISDPTVNQGQRAKMKELAKQRTKQLQEEEEERIRKQKAKALAKLDELNRRTQVVEGSTKKENATNSAFQSKGEESKVSESANLACKSGAASSSMTCSTNIVSQISVISTSKIETSPILSGEPPSEKLEVGKESVLDRNKSATLHQDVNRAEATSAMQVQNNIVAKQKRVGYKQKQNLPSNEKLISVTATAPKVENGTVVDVTVSPGIVTKEVNSTGGSTAMAESTVNQKKKNNKNGKNKHKVEESSSLAASLPLATSKEANLSRSSLESDQPKASNFELNQDSVQPASLSKDPNLQLEQPRNSSNEESHGRLSSQWKSQHSRRMPRNMQANRPTEKSHGNDAVIWAPVKPQNRMEVVDESIDKSKIETANSVKGDQQVYNNLKNKRAEMERYIPKPAAKEMAYQGSVQQVASSINDSSTDEFVGRVGSGSQGPQISQHTTSSPVVKVAGGMESKNGDGRQPKQGKTHGSWRQRGSTESTNVHAAEEGLNSDPNNGQSLQRSTERQLAQKSEMSSVKGQTKHVNDSIDPDGLNNLNNQDPATRHSVSAIRDQAATGRGRRGPFRGHKGMGMNHDIDHKKHDREAEKNELLVLSSEAGQPDVSAAFKENRGVGERMTTHWQPKSQASTSQQGSRPNYHNVGSEASQAIIKKDIIHGSLSLTGGPDKETTAHVAGPHHDQLVLDKGKVGEATNIGSQETKRERRNAVSKVRSQSPSQVTFSSIEPPPTGMDFRLEQRPPSGFRRNGNQNRFVRGHDSRGDWKSSGQDNRHYNQPWERQGHNLQYEYQPVGLHDNSKSDNFERPKDSNHCGGRYRERGQTHSRRGGGNFHGRLGGSFD